MRWILVCLLTLWPCIASASSIVVNGGFESVTGAMPSGGELAAGSSALLGWTVFGSSSANDAVDWVGPGGGGPVWNASEGSHLIDLDGRDSLGGGVSQTLATVVGTTYVLTFDLSGNPGDFANVGLPVVKSVQVTAGTLVRTFQFDTTGMGTSTLTWLPVTVVFTATGSSTFLGFTSLTGYANSYGALIDNVQVEALVPEPSSMAMLGVGLGVLFSRTSRRRGKPGV